MNANSEKTRLRRALLWTWMGVSVLILLYLTLPMMLPGVVRVVAQRFGVVLEGCDLRFAGPVRLFSERCTIRWGKPDASSSAELNALSVSYPPLGRPDIVLQSLIVTLASDAADPAERGTFSVPMFPFSHLTIASGLLRTDAESSVEFHVEAERRSGRTAFDLAMKNLRFPPRLKVPELNLRGTLTEEHGSHVLTVLPDIGQSWILGAAGCEFAGGMSNSDEGVSIRIVEGALSGAAGAVTIALPSATCGGSVLSAAALNLDALRKEESGGFEIRGTMPALSVKSNGANVALGEAALVARFANGILSATLMNPKDGTVPHIDAVVEHDLEQRQGKAEIKLSTPELSAARPLSALVMLESPVAELVAGALRVEAEFFWKEGQLLPVSQVQLSATDLGGSLKDVDVTGLTAKAVINGFPEWKTSIPAELRAASIELGAALTDVVSKVTVKKGASSASYIRVEKIAARLFGGEVSVDGLVVEDWIVRPFVVRLNGLDLSEILTRTGQSVQGTGRLNGEIPVMVVDGAVVVEDGHLIADQPGGELKYVASEAAMLSAMSNPGLDLALRALERFNYEKLSAVVRYEPSGALHADVSLLGRNPALFNGRQVQFNVNIEENIPSLLKSIRLATKAGQEVWQPNQ